MKFEENGFVKNVCGLKMLRELKYAAGALDSQREK